MHKTSSSKSKASSLSKSNRHGNKQSGNDHGRKDKDNNDKDSSGKKYGSHYEPKEGIELGGHQDVLWNQPQSIDAGENENNEESEENSSSKNVKVPRTLNEMRIPKQNQGDDDTQSYEYIIDGESDEKGMPSRDLRDTYQAPHVSFQNTTSDFGATAPQFGSQSPQGTQPHISFGLQSNPPLWNPQLYYQSPSTMQTWASPSGQSGYPQNPGPFAPLTTPNIGYGYTRAVHTQQNNWETAMGTGSAVYPPNVFSSTSMAAAEQSGRGANKQAKNYYNYSQASLGSGFSGADGVRQGGKGGYPFRGEDGFDLQNQTGDAKETMQSSSSPSDRRRSGTEGQLSQKYEIPSKSMADLELTEECPSELEGEDSTEEQNDGSNPILFSSGSLGSPRQRLSYGTKDLQQRQHRQNQSFEDDRNLPLYDSFKVHKSKSFQKGRVFKTLWSEPIGKVKKKTHSVGPSLPSQMEEEFVTDSRYGETAFHSIRRFIVVKERKGHSLCVPILTYGSQGTNKPGVKAEYHAMIFTGREVPSPLPGERLVQRAVRMELSSPNEKLDEESRVNYAKVYTIEHNIKVYFIGKIHTDSRAAFETDFKKIDNQDESEK